MDNKEYWIEIDKLDFNFRGGMVLAAPALKPKY